MPPNFPHKAPFPPMKRNTPCVFENRESAGIALGEAIAPLLAGPPPMVLALPRGGVPVAAPVARALEAPLDVLIVRKLGIPGHEEVAFGAIASGGASVRHDSLIENLGLSAEQIDAVVRRESAELTRRDAVYRGGRPALEIVGRAVVLVDDGIATGSTVEAAIGATRELGASRIIVATPVAPPDTVRRLGRLADEIVVLSQPDPFGSVRRWYRDFSQTTDAEVRALLAASESSIPPGTPTSE